MDLDSALYPLPLPCFSLMSGDQKPDRACPSSVAAGAAYKEVKLASALEPFCREFDLFYREVHCSKHFCRHRSLRLNVDKLTCSIVAS